MIAFYQHLLQEQGAVLLWFNAITIGLFAIGIAAMVRYELFEEELPKNLIYALIILGLFVTVLEPPTRPSMNASVFGMALTGVMFLWVRLLSLWLSGESTIGFAEVKFAGAAGLWVGLQGVIPLLLVSFLYGLIAVAVTYVIRKRRREPASGGFPFSPVLGGATLTVVAAHAFFG